MTLRYMPEFGLIVDDRNRPIAEMRDDSGLSRQERDDFGRLFASAPYLKVFCEVEDARLLREAHQSYDGSEEG